MTAEHGTAVRYKHRGCRCEPCRSANAADVKARRRGRAAMEPPRHGESGYNNYGCRCDVCKAGVAAGARRRRAAKEGAS